MKKIIFGTLFLLLLIVIFIPHNHDNHNEKETVKIGMVIPLSGSYSNMGKSNHIVSKIVIDEINNIDTKYNYEFIIEDSRSETRGAALAVNKLMNIDKVNSIIPLYSRAFKAAKKYSDNGEVITFGCSWGDSLGKGKYNLNAFTSSKLSTKRLVKELQSRNVKKLAVVLVATPGGEDIWDNLENALSGTGIEVVFDKRVKPGETDYRLLVSKMMQHNIDNIFLALSPFEAELFVREIRTQNLKVPLSSINTIVSIVDKKIVEGEWFVSLLTPKEDFQKKYNDRSDLEIQICAPQTYNAMNILVEAFENAASINKKDVIEYINNMESFNGAAGEVILEDNNFNQQQMPIAIIKNGKVEILKEE